VEALILVEMSTLAEVSTFVDRVWRLDLVDLFAAGGEGKEKDASHHVAEDTDDNQDDPGHRTNGPADRKGKRTAPSARAATDNAEDQQDRTDDDDKELHDQILTMAAKDSRAAGPDRS
jgi:hypothetical protein